MSWYLHTLWNDRYEESGDRLSPYEILQYYWPHSLAVYYTLFTYYIYLLLLHNWRLTPQSPSPMSPHHCCFAFHCELIFILSWQCVSCSELDTSLQNGFVASVCGFVYFRGFVSFRPVLISLPEIPAQRKKYKIIPVILDTDYLSLYNELSAEL